MLYGFAGQVDGMVAPDDRGARSPSPGDVNRRRDRRASAPLVVEECASITEHQPWLTLLGLELVFERNSLRHGGAGGAATA